MARTCAVVRPLVGVKMKVVRSSYSIQSMTCTTRKGKSFNHLWGHKPHPSSYYLILAYRLMLLKTPQGDHQPITETDWTIGVILTPPNFVVIDQKAGRALAHLQHCPNTPSVAPPKTCPQYRCRSSRRPMELLSTVQTAQQPLMARFTLHGRLSGRRVCPVSLSPSTARSHHRLLKRGVLGERT
jgi:hypothetical protein